MRVLHVYQPNDIMANQYVARIMKAMPHELENRKACSWEEARDIVNDWHPDIFHLHGDASPFSSHLTSLTAPRLVISPHGNLLPDSLADKAYVVIARSETEQKSGPGTIDFNMLVPMPQEFLETGEWYDWRIKIL